MKHLILLATIVALASCGGGKRDYLREVKMTRTASGPISRACMDSDRKARNPQLCGCVQAVANDSLSGNDQRMAVSFFKDPHRAQEIRQSSNSAHERFWLKYKAFTAEAERICA